MAAINSLSLPSPKSWTLQLQSKTSVQKPIILFFADTFVMTPLYLAWNFVKLQGNYELSIHGRVKAFKTMHYIYSWIREAWKRLPIVWDQNRQMCHSLRCKQIDISMAKRLISNF